MEQKTKRRRFLHERSKHSADTIAKKNWSVIAPKEFLSEEAADWYIKKIRDNNENMKIKGKENFEAIPEKVIYPIETPWGAKLTTEEAWYSLYRGLFRDYTTRQFESIVKQYLDKVWPDDVILSDFLVYSWLTQRIMQQHYLWDNSDDDWSHAIDFLMVNVERTLEVGGLKGKLEPWMVKFTLKNRLNWSENKWEQVNAREVVAKTVDKLRELSDEELYKLIHWTNESKPKLSGATSE